ncbi:hypothetical protein KC19_VG148000 [Ceratodon purpureus]|uniref:Uncharacterized protein n=1 Tax=Ceratodon purpureus TaxID=3225 RepID=A0A8T0HQL3_CERPU|nr:hypothetical protein KC19_VG148000 [Ceratodon purpureus]KAG0573091.1 hypothetical protein KC19_VG148000 [Ceratodon purpureus]
MRAPARAAMADQVGLGFTRARCGTSAEGQWFTASMFVYYCYDEEGGVAQFIAEALGCYVMDGETCASDVVSVV